MGQDNNDPSCSVQQGPSLAATAARIRGHPRLTRTVQQCKQCATSVGQSPTMLPLRHQGRINGCTNHSPMSTLQINDHRSQDLPMEPSLAELHRVDIGTMGKEGRAMAQLRALTPAQISHKSSRNVHPGWAQTAQRKGRLNGCRTLKPKGHP